MVSSGSSKQGGSLAGHILTCLLPVIGGSLVISVLVQLLVRLDQKIYDDSISNSLAAFEPYNAVVIPSTCAICGRPTMIIRGSRH